LRRDQPTYGKSITVKLDATQGLAIYIPKGCAHGFLTISPDALTLYNVTSVHAPSSDSGLHWQSIGLDWPVGDPIISDRDKSLPSLHDFKSPF
jgi:dTDP-4-dehydrorhamnose 3,5-epimerase